MISNLNKLEALEAIIIEMRDAGVRRTSRHTGQYKHWLALKALASDLRARFEDKPGAVRLALTKRIGAIENAKERVGGYPDKALMGLGEELLGSWPVIRQALEQFEKDLRVRGEE